MNNSLDNRIIVNVTGILYTYDTISTYEVIDNTNPSYATTIFRGNTFIKAGTTSKSFDITDIIRNYRWIPDVTTLPNTTNTNYVEVMKVFAVKFGGRQVNTYVNMVYQYPHYLDYMESGWSNESFFIPLQGNIDNKPLLVPHYPMVNTDNYHLQTLIHSEDERIIDEIVQTDGYKSMFIYETDEYNRDLYITQPLSTTLNNISGRMDIAYNATSDVPGMQYYANDGRIDFRSSQTWGDDAISSVILSLNQNGNWVTVSSQTVVQPSLGYDFYVELPTEWWEGIWSGRDYFRLQFTTSEGRYSVFFYPRVPRNIPRMQMRMTYYTPYTGSPNHTYEMFVNWFSLDWIRQTPYTIKFNDLTAAVLDECPAPYYLQWQDRMGSFQSQPFNGKYQYSETLDRQHIKNYRERTKLSNINITSKWELNTDWIDEKLYPIYESIFTSPFLILYDVANDKSYNVIATGDWVEKRHNRDNKLINLNLEVEDNTTQNIIY